MTDGRGLRTSAVYEQLRNDILEGKLSPAERLKTAYLSTRFNVSMTVVREALTRLAEQGIVVATPRSGFVVTPLSTADLTDLTRVRIGIETLALQDSIEHGDLPWETLVVGTHHTLARTPRPGKAEDGGVAWRQGHREFHHALLSGCGSPRLLAIACSLRDSSELYRAWSRTLARDTRRDFAAEHHALLDRVLARDADGAVAALTQHIERTTAALLDFAAASGSTAR